jgi:hypothetical protein
MKPQKGIEGQQAEGNFTDYGCSEEPRATERSRSGTSTEGTGQPIPFAKARLIAANRETFMTWTRYSCLQLSGGNLAAGSSTTSISATVGAIRSCSRI